ncbi:MAG: hypothetical protein LBG07_00585 [Treponema sp.]|jgi:hypothetical protein|nr:hypothetical protein [Treponema sp.]
MKHTPLALLFLFSFLGCSNPRKSPPVPAETETPPSPPLEYGRYPLALLQSGEAPLWFELGGQGQGPALIPSPEEAPLHPFIPWSLARRVAGITGREDRVILGINREGFLAFVPWAGGEHEGIALYRIDNNAHWKDYSVGALFIFDSKAAAMLYRDDYFIDTALPPPSPRVWGLDPAAGMRELIVEAFEGLPPEEGWDLEALRQGPDNRWRFRAIRKTGPLRGIGYFSAGDLSQPGEPSTEGAMQNALRPRPHDQAPEPLRQVLEAALVPGDSPSTAIATVASPEFESPRRYAASRTVDAIREDIRLYNGYYLGSGGNAAALVVGPEGRGFAGVLRDGVCALREFALPDLPKGFVYTGAAFFLLPAPSGGISLTALGVWEEQDNWNVGAAGFVLSPDCVILEP